jgi:hypothetical protein
VYVFGTLAAPAVTAPPPTIAAVGTMVTSVAFSSATTAIHGLPKPVSLHVLVAT